MGGPNLEVFKFGMYIMFPIGIMYYFGTNLDSRFAVPDFWPKPGQTHTIPFEREDITAELERLKQRRLAARARRLEMERQDQQNAGGEASSASISSMTLEKSPNQIDTARSHEEGKRAGWLSWFR